MIGRRRRGGRAVQVSPPPARDSVLELAGVSKHYPGTPPIRALDGIDLTIRAGEFVVIVGPSGSGKSTLINVVGALHRPTTGVVRIDGHDVSRLSDARLAAVRGRRIGFVFQQFHLVEGLTALENVATGLLYSGIDRSERLRRARLALDRVGLGDKAGRKPGQLSGGERQRVGIGRALVGDPAIILADEPTGNLDSRTGTAIVELFRELHAAGHTVVLITHDRDIAGQAPRQVALLDGAVVDDLARAS
jgi:putative ABC transport system ATP-binding protein